MGLTRKRSAGTLRALVMAVCGLWATGVAADGIRLDRYSASELPDDAFHVSRPTDLGHLRWAAMLHLDYANDSLVMEAVPGDTASEEASAVSDHLVGHMRFAYGLWDQLVIFAGLDVNLLMKGDQVRDPANPTSFTNLADGAGLGDARLGARWTFLGAREDLFAMGIQASLLLPLAQAANSEQNFSGDSSVGFLPELLVELRPGIFQITGNLGVNVRGDVTLGNTTVQDELSFGLAGTLKLLRGELQAIVELDGATTFGDLFGRESTPLELLAGGKWLPASGFTVGLAGGPGLQRGVGAPDYRLVAMFGYAQPVRREPPPEPTRDTDGDGLLDPDDGCPLAPEDRDQFEDADGCPDPDNDRDGVLDAADRCPLEPEDADDFEDADGCPDPDNDQDGLLDAADRCPLEPEDTDDFEDADGCPDPDNDQDGVPDVDDACVLEPGLAKERGCPGSVRIEGSRIRILKRVEFAVNKDRILASSEPLLEEVRATIAANPQLKRVRVEGHTDDRGRDARNLDLSRRRAGSVVRWLAERGIAGERLEGWGCGEVHPIETNGSAEGRQANRRVEFRIVDPAPTEALDREGCVPAD